MSLSILTNGRISVGGIEREVIRREPIDSIAHLLDDDVKIQYSLEGDAILNVVISELNEIGYSIVLVDGVDGNIDDVDISSVVDD